MKEHSTNKHYLFLDIDGVLNARQYCKCLHENNLVEFDKNSFLFDSRAIENLKHIIDSYRYYHNFHLEI